jgi:regulator of protease activity HflC (stomatin/prohibitin superfamily)
MIAVLVFLWLINSLKIVNEYERVVIFRLGRVIHQPAGPGFVFVLWPIDRAVVVPMRLIVLDVPPQDIITKDNVSAKVNAVVISESLIRSEALLRFKIISMPRHRCPNHASKCFG